MITKSASFRDIRNGLQDKLAFIADNFVYYFSLFAPIAFYAIVFSYFFTNNNASDLATTSGKIWFGVKIIWYSNILLSVTNLAGIFMFGSPRRRDQKNLERFTAKRWDGRKKLKIVYVSRGDNRAALSRSVLETLKQLHKYDVNYLLEIVTDVPVWDKVKANPKINIHVVPLDYVTKKGAKYKARALHYVIERRGVTEKQVSYRDTWVLHLDEESLITPECLAGVAKFIHDPATSRSIGQGEIKYNSHKYGSNVLITAIDSIRTGDDLGRFRFQYRLLKRPVFGMHGSYFLVPQYLEKYIGFDLGGKGSITEDAYFALHAAEKGVSFQWIDGYIREQSPFTISAILKQRRRWFCGLKHLSFDKKLRLKTRWILLINTLLWTLGWLGPIITIANFFHPNGYAPLAFVLTAAVAQGSYAGAYLLGSYRNLLNVNMNIFRKLFLYFSTFILLPISSFIEGVAILYAIIKPVKTFDVVRK